MMAIGTLTFDTLAKAARISLDRRNLSELHKQRLDLEIDEIIKQGAQRYWVEAVQANKKWASNPNGLLLPWLLNRLQGPANVDPLSVRTDPLVLSTKYKDITSIIQQCGKLPFDVVQDNDKPDIDIDCLPYARDEIKAYASRRYGEKNVASVGTWQTFLFKQAILDCYRALGLGPYEKGDGKGDTGRDQEKRNEALDLLKDLPDDINEMKDGGFGVCKGQKTESQETVGPDGNTITVENTRQCGVLHNLEKCPDCGSESTESPTFGAVLKEHPSIRAFMERSEKHREVILWACRLIGKVRSPGKHAGAIIIADRDLFGNIPMVYDRKADQWVSVWTEGRNTQLSKFGYNKWDILGLKNLLYIYECCRMIKENHDVSFGDALEGLDDADPLCDKAGVYWENGEEHIIQLNDPAAIDLANRSKTDAIFQFDTDLAKRILSNGVSSFNDLLVFNAMGHPGPLQCCRSDSNINIRGGVVQIRDLDNSRHELQYVARDGVVKHTKNFTVWRSSRKKIYKIKLSNGITINVSGDHKILTDRGYVQAKDLTASDKVCYVK